VVYHPKRSKGWLADRNLYIRTSRFARKPSFLRTLEINNYLAQAIKVFEDFKLMAEMRQEIDKLKEFVPI
jgi:hypothetical protein